MSSAQTTSARTLATTILATGGAVMIFNQSAMFCAWPRRSWTSSSKRAADTARPARGQPLLRERLGQVAEGKEVQRTSPIYKNWVKP